MVFLSVFFQVSATDPDCGENGVVSYSIAKDLGFTLPDELTMEPNTGQLCVALPLDFEAVASYEFPISASDQGEENFPFPAPFPFIHRHRLAFCGPLAFCQKSVSCCSLSKALLVYCV